MVESKPRTIRITGDMSAIYAESRKNLFKPFGSLAAVVNGPELDAASGFPKRIDSNDLPLAAPRSNELSPGSNRTSAALEEHQRRENVRRASMARHCGHRVPKIGFHTPI